MLGVRHWFPSGQDSFFDAVASFVLVSVFLQDVFVVAVDDGLNVWYATVA